MKPHLYDFIYIVLIFSVMVHSVFCFSAGLPVSGSRSVDRWVSTGDAPAVAGLLGHVARDLG